MSLHHNGANSYLFVNGTDIRFKAKDSEIVVTPLCLENISKDLSVVNIKKPGLNGYVYDFRVNYDATAVDDIKDIHKYLMKKNNIVWYVSTCLKDTSHNATYNKMFRFAKKIFLMGSLFSPSLLSTTPLSCISMINQACKVRPEIINTNSNEPIFYPFSIKTSKYSGSCNNINNPYANAKV